MANSVLRFRVNRKLKACQLGKLTELRRRGPNWSTPLWVYFVTSIVDDDGKELTIVHMYDGLHIVYSDNEVQPLRRLSALTRSELERLEQSLNVTP